MVNYLIVLKVAEYIIDEWREISYMEDDISKSVTKATTQIIEDIFNAAQDGDLGKVLSLKSLYRNTLCGYYNNNNATNEPDDGNNNNVTIEPDGNNNNATNEPDGNIVTESDILSTRAVKKSSPKIKQTSYLFDEKMQNNDKLSHNEIIGTRDGLILRATMLIPTDNGVSKQENR
jgi:hypothetical protein